MLKNIISYGFTLAFLQLLIACGPAPEEGQAALKDVATVSTETGGDQKAAAKEAEILIVAFGDSLYAGYGLDQKQGFAPGPETGRYARQYGSDGQEIAGPRHHGHADRHAGSAQSGRGIW